MMGGGSKGKSAQSVNNKPASGGKFGGIVSTGYGGHHRAVQGFKMQRALAV